MYKPTRLLPYSLRVHLIEADRIATPTGSGLGTSLLYTTGKNPDNGNTIYDGVEVDKDGMVVPLFCLIRRESQHLPVDPAL